MVLLVQFRLVVVNVWIISVLGEKLRNVIVQFVLLTQKVIGPAGQTGRNVQRVIHFNFIQRSTVLDYV